jgi:hypothetical protein
MRFLKLVSLCVATALAASICSYAQAKGPGGGPGGAPSAGGTPPGAPPTGGVAPGIPPGDSNTTGTPPAGGRTPGNSSSAQSSIRGTSSPNNRTTRSSIQFGPVGRWWDNKKVIDAIGLTKDQKKRMDSIFNQNKPAILGSYKTFLNEQAKLDALGKNPKTDQARLFSAIDAVSQARAALQKATAQMFMQIRSQMDTEQIQKLEKLQ